ncbi:MAG: hypothetical protein PGN11_14105 [Quadrisphaera sp.]
MARLRAAGCVFAEEEAALLLAEGSSAAALEERVRRRERGEPLELVLGWAEFAGLRVGDRRGGVRAPAAQRAAGPGGARRARRAPVCGGGWRSGTRRRRRPVLRDGRRGGWRWRWPPRGPGRPWSCTPPTSTRWPRPAPPRTSPGTPPGRWGRTRTPGDLYAALPAQLRGRVDLLLVNAPYVPTDSVALMPPEARDHEPLTALDGGSDGLDVHRRVAAGAREWLAPGGGAAAGDQRAAGGGHRGGLPVRRPAAGRRPRRRPGSGVRARQGLAWRDRDRAAPPAHRRCARRGLRRLRRRRVLPPDRRQGHRRARRGGR